MMVIGRVGLLAKCDIVLGKPSCKKSAVFLNIVQKAFDPPPLSFEHHVVIFLVKILWHPGKLLDPPQNQVNARLGAVQGLKI